MAICRCSFRDWARLRRALGISQLAMAGLLELEQGQVSRLETTDPTQHRCASRQTIVLLRYSLQLPEYKAALNQANYTHPFPDDGAA